MRVSFKRANFDALASLWNSCSPDAYRITPELLRYNTVDSPVFDWGASCMDIDDDGKPTAFIYVKRPAISLYKVRERDTAHIGGIICPSPEVGVDLMSYIKGVLRDRGMYRVTFGQGARHFYPGCPNDFVSLRDFLTIEGFEQGGEIYDVQRDLATYQPPPGALDCLSSEARVRPLQHDELQAFWEFMTREFPGRWAYDVLNKVDAEGRPEIVSVLHVGGEIGGFALTQDSSHKDLIGGACFHLSLGENWGSVGPIGVAKGLRGKGFGDALLSSTLLTMKSAGVRQCVIDWTVLLEWYGKHGFAPGHTYRAFTLALDVV
jgi:GNAT superfamily N-acetyltransferase